VKEFSLGKGGLFGIPGCYKTKERSYNIPTIKNKNEYFLVLVNSLAQIKKALPNLIENTFMGY